MSIAIVHKTGHVYNPYSSLNSSSKLVFFTNDRNNVTEVLGNADHVTGVTQTT